MGLFLGLDPGGAGNQGKAPSFGWCVLESTTNQPPLQLVAHGIANYAGLAVAASLGAIGNGTLDSAGIDAPLFWQPDGARPVDTIVRARVTHAGGNGGTVNEVNSMQGACLIQGMMAAMLLRGQYPKLRITESHPKALLWHLGIANISNPPGQITLSNLNHLIRSKVAITNQHERDAALSAYTAFAMTTNQPHWANLYLNKLSWTTQYPNRPYPISPLNPLPEYWFP